MALTEDDLKAMATLMGQAIEPLRDEMNQRFREVDARFDYWYKQDEKREQEYLAMTEQLKRIEADVTVIKNSVGGHEERIQALEQKCA